MAIAEAESARREREVQAASLLRRLSEQHEKIMFLDAALERGRLHGRWEDANAVHQAAAAASAAAASSAAAAAASATGSRVRARGVGGCAAHGVGAEAPVGRGG